MPQQTISDVLKKGEEIFQSVSGKLLEQPAVQKAVEAAMAGKSRVDEGMALAFKRMNVQTRSEFRNLKNRVEGLESQISALQEALKAAQTELKKPAKPRARKAAKKA